MKKNTFSTKVVGLLFLLLINFASIAQIKSNLHSIENLSKIASDEKSSNKNANNLSNILSPLANITVVTACNSFTWTQNNQTFTSSGLFTAPDGVTQSFNNQANWLSSASDEGATVATNTLSGIPNANPVVATIGTITAAFTATGGIFSSGSFVGTSSPNTALTITFSTPIYSVSSNNFVTNATNSILSGNITTTYFNGTTILFSDTRNGVSSDTILFGYSSLTPITKVVISVATSTPAVNRFVNLKNMSIATNPTATLNLTIENPPVTSGFTVCQGQSVSSGLISTLSPIPVSNFGGNTTGGLTYNRPTAMNQGGTCGNSAAGTAVLFASHNFIAPVNGSYIFSTCGGATFDTFLALYQSPFNPAGLCAGNNLVESSDDACGSQSTITVDLIGGTAYTLVISGFNNTESGPYVITTTNPIPASSIEWFTTATGGTSIGSGSPFNPVGVAGSGLTNTNTIGNTPFFAQFPGGTCRTLTNFTVALPTNPTFNPIVPICSGATLSALPTTSTNGIFGTWSPALNNTTTTTYTFTPNSGLCASTATLTIEVATPVTTSFSICQGATVSGGLISNLSNATPLPNYSGNNFGSLTYNRPTAMNQGGICGNSAAGTAVHFTTHSFIAPVTGSYIFSTCGGASFDTFLALYQSPFNPAGLCAGNNLVESSDDSCGSQSTITVDLIGGIAYTLVISGFSNTESGPYVITTTSPSITSNVEWYTTSTGGSPIGSGSPFNPVGVAGSGLLNTNTLGNTPFFAQFPGRTCRTLANFNVATPTTPTFNLIAPICSGATLSALPTTSTNGIVGTWSPALNNTATTTYTFTPSSILCANTNTITITVNSVSTPTGAAVQTIIVSNPNIPTVANLVVSPTNVIWYGSLTNAQTGTNPLPNSTVVVNGSSYFAVNVVGSCFSTPLQVTVNVTLSNDDFTKEDFTIYPNPTSSILNISNSREISEISVINLLGQIVMTKKTNAREVQVDLSTLPEATYLVKIFSDENEKTVKVIKKN